MNSRLAYPAFWIAASLALVLASLYARPLIPVDETRYVGVAWEMWLRGDFLVPFKNGLPYSHKPPLLFWLFHIGWSVFGVNEWWPRIVPALFALGSLFLTATLARRLWPENARVAWLAPTIVLGCLYWAAYTPMTMFDLVLTFWVLLGVLGVWLAARGERKGWVLVALGIGLGTLTKGPVALLHILPVAVLAPWWSERVRAARMRWYGALLLAIVIGATLVLAWAIPAAIHGGAAYREAIFWGQTAGRISKSFAHQREWWWYLPTLPVVLFPWFFWWPAWRSLRAADESRDPRRVRFIVAWSVPVFVAFSAISGKQLHYLLPLYPALALLIGAGLLRQPDVSVRALLPVSLVIAGLGVLLLNAPGMQAERHLPAWVADIPAWGGILLILLAAMLPLAGQAADAERHIRLLAVNGVLVVLILILAVMRPAAPYYDISLPARMIATYQRNHVPVAHIGKYHDQFQFAGRLQQPLTILTPDRISAWIEVNPTGRIITTVRKPDHRLTEYAALRFPYRGRWLLFVRASDWFKGMPGGK